MGDGERETPTKTPKSASTQEQPPNSPAGVYPDWASFQAYYNSAGTPPLPSPAFFHSPVPSSPQTHPYMWGQHMMPPFGTPHPYVAMYPHGGLYGHPSIPPGSHPYAHYAMPAPNGTAEASAAQPSGVELEGKSTDGKKGSVKKSRGSLGCLSTLTGKGNDIGRASANGAASDSSESENGTSSEGSDANSQNGSQKPGRRQGSTDDEEAQNGNAFVARPSSNHTVGVMPMPSNGMVGPATNLNIGMDFWGGPAAAIRGKLGPVPSQPPIVPSNFMGTRDGVSSEHWLQDEKELKRQRRKQSNRESARRSRLRKQAECEELAQRVESLKQENSSMREELERLHGECEKLIAENSSLTERLNKHQGELPKPDQGAEDRLND